MIMDNVDCKSLAFWKSDLNVTNQKNGCEIFIRKMPNDCKALTNTVVHSEEISTSISSKATNHWQKMVVWNPWNIQAEHLQKKVDIDISPDCPNQFSQPLMNNLNSTQHSNVYPLFKACYSKKYENVASTLSSGTIKEKIDQEDSINLKMPGHLIKSSLFMNYNQQKSKDEIYSRVYRPKFSFSELAFKSSDCSANCTGGDFLNSNRSFLIKKPQVFEESECLRMNFGSQVFEQLTKSNNHYIKIQPRIDTNFFSNQQNNISRIVQQNGNHVKDDSKFDSFKNITATSKSFPDNSEEKHFERLVLNQVEDFPVCNCAVPRPYDESIDGPFYTHLGVGSSVQEIREIMIKRLEILDCELRLEKVVYTGKEGKSLQGCPIAKWIIRRSSLTEKVLVLVRQFKHHYCSNSVIVVGICLWEGLPQDHATELYDYLRITLPKCGEATERRCATNEKKSCACQGWNESTGGASFSFGCSWSMFYNGCKFARSTSPRKFHLRSTPEEELILEHHLQTLATVVAPIYAKVAPASFKNQTAFESVASDCRLGYKPGRPWSGVTAVVDFCTHAHKDFNNMNNGCTTEVEEGRKKKGREIGKVRAGMGEQAGTEKRAKKGEESGEQESERESKRGRKWERKRKKDRKTSKNPGQLQVLTLTKHRGFGKPEDEQLHVLPMCVLDSTDEYGSQDGLIKKIHSGAIECLSSFPAIMRIRPTPFLCKRKLRLAKANLKKRFGWTSHVKNYKKNVISSAKSCFSLPSFCKLKKEIITHSISNPIGDAANTIKNNYITAVNSNSTKSCTSLPDFSHFTSSLKSFKNLQRGNSFGMLPSFSNFQKLDYSHSIKPTACEKVELPVNSNFTHFLFNSSCNSLNKTSFKKNDNTDEIVHRNIGPPRMGASPSVSNFETRNNCVSKHGTTPFIIKNKMNKDCSVLGVTSPFRKTISEKHIQSNLSENNIFGVALNSLHLPSETSLRFSQKHEISEATSSNIINSNTPACDKSFFFRLPFQVDGADEAHEVKQEFARTFVLHPNSSTFSSYPNANKSGKVLYDVATPAQETPPMPFSSNFVCCPEKSPFKAILPETNHILNVAHPSFLEDPSKQQVQSKLEVYTNNSDAFRNETVGGVAIALTHGSLLFEVAKRELHATTALKNPDRSQPTRMSLVFYQHKSLNRAKHGHAEYEKKCLERNEKKLKQELEKAEQSKKIFSEGISSQKQFFQPSPFIQNDSHFYNVPNFQFENVEQSNELKIKEQRPHSSFHSPCLSSFEATKFTLSSDLTQQVIPNYDPSVPLKSENLALHHHSLNQQ